MLGGLKLPRFPLLVALTATLAWGSVARAQQPVAPAQAAPPTVPSDPQPGPTPPPQVQQAQRGALMPTGPSAAPGPAPQVSASISPYHDQQSLVNQGDQRPPGESSGE